ncbi:MAG: Hsp20/alpha crystallin family protein [Sphaerobacter sp.]|nr:Hsp20/alpha crystallin family protein [Sphaerobacter sp.]
MSITRWDPWSEFVSLREAMDQLIRESFIRPAEAIARVSGLGMSIPIDVRDTDDAYIITASMPGVRPEDVNIQVTGETLQISGETREEREELKAPEGEARHGTWLVRERRHGRFERTITLPSAVKADAAEAMLENGVLTLRLPKAEGARSRTIPIRTGRTTQSIEAQARTTSQG